MEGSSKAEIVEMDFVDLSENRPATPEELIAAASTATEKLLPAKSKARYEQVYYSFQQWKEEKKTTSNSERVLLAYFTELISNNNMPSTLWSKYSILKATMKVKNQVDISTYASLAAMLKQASKGHVPKQARIFTEEEVKRFVETTPDVAWLDVGLLQTIFVRSL